MWFNVRGTVLRLFRFVNRKTWMVIRQFTCGVYGNALAPLAASRYPYAPHYLVWSSFKRRASGKSDRRCTLVDCYRWSAHLRTILPTLCFRPVHNHTSALARLPLFRSRLRLIRTFHQFRVHTGFLYLYIRHAPLFTSVSVVGGANPRFSCGSRVHFYLHCIVTKAVFNYINHVTNSISVMVVFDRGSY